MNARYRWSLAWLLASTAPSGCIVGIADPVHHDDGGGESSADGSQESNAPEASDGPAASDASDAPQEAAGDSTVEGGADAPTESAIDAPGDVAQDVTPLTHYVVFTTSAAYMGNFGGLSGADQKCQMLANGKLAGTFKAWLSDSNTSAATHLTTHGALPYVLVDGTTVVANDWTELTSGSLQHMIDLDESGNQVATADTCSGFGGHYVWTDSNDDGSIFNTAQSCQNWTSAASTDNGSTGSASLNQATSYWSNWCNLQACDTPASLYCVQQ